MNSRLCLMLGVASLYFVAAAKTVYVDVNRPDDSGDGLSWATAKHTIQAAVNAAVQDDTVLVGPGVYDEGYGMPGAEPEFKNRVYINKGIRLESTDGAEATHIVGAYDPDTRATEGMMGNGPKAIRCVTVAHGATPLTIIKGFTLRDGAAHPRTAKESVNAANGGGFRRYDSNANAWLVDCVVKNCTGVRGGAMSNGRAIRTRITGNTAVVKGGAGTFNSCWFCVIDGNSAPSAGVCVGGNYVNCTIVNNFNCGTLFTEAAKVYNSIAVQNDGTMASYELKEEFRRSLLSSNGHVTIFDEETIQDASPMQFLAPYVGDYRLLPTAQAVGFASVDHLTAFNIPDAIDTDHDFAGNLLDRTQPLHAGAVQALATPASGFVWFRNADVRIDGQASVGHANYVFTETYPAQFQIEPGYAKTTADSDLFGWKVTTDADSKGLYRFPTADDKLWFMPPAAGHAYTNEYFRAERVLYVDAAGAAAGEGTKANPFNTIQKACNAVPQDNSRHVIHVAEGTYDSEEDLIVRQGMTNRVTLVSGQYIRMIGAGRDKTVIKGKADPNGPAGDGRGPAAIRCVSADYSMLALQDVTLADGYVDYIGANGTQDTPATAGGGARFDNQRDYHLIDCTVTNCVGARGAVYNGRLIRSRVTDCLGHVGGLRYVTLISSVIDNMKDLAGNGNAFPYANGCSAYQCTFVGRTKAEHLLTNNGTHSENLVLTTTKLMTAAYDITGSVVWDVDETVSLSEAQASQYADPLLPRKANADYTPLACSPALGGGVLTATYADTYSSDFNNQPIRFVDGRPTAGAYQTFCSGYGVELPNPAYGIKVEPAGCAELAPGESVTITVDLSEAVRPCTQIAVNGVVTNATVVTVTGPAAGAPIQAVRVTPVVTPHWYVDPTGSDAADGFTPATAKKTFKGVFDTGYVLAGDTVHAAEGRYEEGEMPMPESGAKVNCRVAIPDGVSVVGAGRDKSFIVGQSAPAATADAYGRGEGAVRCVYIRDSAYLKGFTLTGGRTWGTGVQDNNNYGGGVYAYGTKSYVSDCDIIDNASSRGGGAHQGRYVNCRFFRNRVCNNRAAASNAYLYGCIIDENYGVNAIQNCYDTVNCTFGPNNRTEDGSEATLAVALVLGPVVNCVIMGNYNATEGNPLYATNCLFTAGLWTQDWYHLSDCRQVSVADIVLDADYKPVLGTAANAPVDAGTTEGLALYPAGFSQETDVYGGARVYNGRIDVGAVEADWRPVYAKAMGRRVTVESATPDVTLGPDGKVHLAEGAQISGVWTLLISEGQRATCTVAATDVAGTLADNDLTFNAPFDLTVASPRFVLSAAGTTPGIVDAFTAFVPGFLVIIR